jgi:putative phosphoribosyl transferase
MSRSLGREDDNGVLFHDRTEAGQLLAKRLMTYAARRDVLVLALPRGGVPVGFEVAQVLRCSSGCFRCAQVGVARPGGVGDGGACLGRVSGIGPRCPGSNPGIHEVINAATVRAQSELERQEDLYRGKPQHSTFVGRPSSLSMTVSRRAQRCGLRFLPFASSTVPA